MLLDFGNISNHEADSIYERIKSGMVSSASPDVLTFERRFGKYINAYDAVATNTGTAALHLAMILSEVGPGDEVIIPALTFIATANAVSYMGAKPIIVDVERDTWCIDPYEIENHITDRTRAIVPVHLYGNPAEMDVIMDIADEHGLVVREDASESVDARYLDDFTGVIGHFGCFSFNGNKTMTTGGGGMLVSRHIDLEYARKLSTQCKELDGNYSGIGYNYRMTGLSAMLGLAQMYRLAEFTEKKKRFNEIYRKELQDLVTFQEESIFGYSSWWMTGITTHMPAIELQERLSKKNIPSRRLFLPINKTEPYFNIAHNPVAQELYIYGLCLPSSTINSEGEVLEVCKAIRGILEG